MRAPATILLVILIMTPLVAVSFRSNIGFWKTQVPAGSTCPVVVGTPATNVGGWVYTYAQHGGNTYIGGSLSSINSTSRGGFGAVDSAGNLLPFNPRAGNGGSSGSISSMKVVGDTLYVGGSFTGFGNQTSTQMIDTDPTSGALRFALPSLAGSILYWESSVSQAIPDGTGGWFIGGDFTHVGGVLRHGLARLNADGTLHPWNPGLVDPDFNYTWDQQVIRSLKLDGNILYVGGPFLGFDGQSRSGVAAFDITVNTNGLLPFRADVSGPVMSFEKSGNDLYVGGAFTVAGFTDQGALGILNIAGDVERTVQAEGVIQTVIADGVGGWYVGGSFTSIGGIPRSSLARVNSDGSIHPFSVAANGNINQLILDGTQLYVAGTFTSLGGQVRRRLGRIDVTDPLSPSVAAFHPDFNNDVTHLEKVGDVLYVAGSFGTVGGISRARLVAIDTTLDTANLKAWAPVPSSTVGDLHLDGTTLYVGGNFTTIAGVSRLRLASFDLSGADPVLMGWNPTANSLVDTITSSATTVYIGGTFSQVGGLSRSQLAAVSKTPDTGNVTAWTPGATGLVKSLHYDSNQLYGWVQTGQGISVGGSVQNGIFRLDTTVNSNQSLSPPAAYHLGSLHFVGGKIAVGGSITLFGGGARSSLAKFRTDIDTNNLLNWIGPRVSGFTGMQISRLILDSARSALYAGGYFTLSISLKSSQVLQAEGVSWPS